MRRLSGHHSDALDKGIVGQGFPIEVYNVLGAATASCRVSCAAGCAARTTPRPPPGPMPAAPSRSRACCVRPRSLPGRNFNTSSATAAPQGAAQGRGDQPHPLGHDAPTAARYADGVGHRPPQAAHRHGGAHRRATCAHQRLQASCHAGHRESVGRQAGFGTLLDDIYGREAMFDAARLGLWVGRPLEEPGSRPLRFEFTQDVGARLCRVAGHPHGQMPVLLSSDDPTELRAEQSRKVRTLYEAARQVGRELMVEIIAASMGPWTTPRSPAPWRSLCPGHQARLVEARAASDSDGVAEHRRRHPQT